MKHPREVLLGAQAAAMVLPVCDHYSGVEARMRKSLQLQAELLQEFGVCVMDVTLDCEDGAPVGGEREHAELVVSLATSASPEARVAVRVHPVDHPAFEQDLAILVGQASSHWRHIMLPKVETVADIEQAQQSIDAAGGAHLPLHALIESPLAVHNAFDIAAHPRVQSLSFGLMDFVSPLGHARKASDCQRLPRPWQNAVTLRGDRIQRCPSDAKRCAPRRSRVWIYPHVEHSPKPSTPLVGGVFTLS